MEYLEVRGVSFNRLNLKDFRDIPILLDKNNIPDRIREVGAAVADYGLVVIFAPEHNGYFSAFFKNILDWLSLLHIPFWERSRLIVVSASTTEREHRIMEAGVKSIMGRFTSEPVEFINFNRYGKRSSREMENLYGEIFRLIT